MLGLPGPTPLSFDLPATPRTFSTPGDSRSRGSNNLYQPGIFLDSDSDAQQQVSDISALQWSPNYAPRSGNSHVTTASAIPIHRFQSEGQQSWTPLRVAPPLKPSSSTVEARQKLGQRQGPNSRFRPGPGSDRVSGTNDTDEGYYTNSQPDVQSVHSMGPWNFTPDRSNVQHTRMAAPSPYLPSGPGTDAEQTDLDGQHDQINIQSTLQSQHGRNPLACTREDCKHISKTPSDLK